MQYLSRLKDNSEIGLSIITICLKNSWGWWKDQVYGTIICVWRRSNVSENGLRIQIGLPFRNFQVLGCICVTILQDLIWMFWYDRCNVWWCVIVYWLVLFDNSKMVEYQSRWYVSPSLKEIKIKVQLVIQVLKGLNKVYQ